MPIVEPPTLTALGLVPFQVNPHYVPGVMSYQDADGKYHSYFGETRDDRLREFHEENSIPVIGLWEGGILDCDGKHIKLLGTPARLFRQGQPTVEYAAGSEIIL